MDAAAIAASIKQFILNRFPSARRRPLQDTDPLLENGVIDSLGVLDVVTFLESQFNVVVADEELVPENFESISRIATYVDRKRSTVG
jgi:acyl carrier protein